MPCIAFGGPVATDSEVKDNVWLWGFCLFSFFEIGSLYIAQAGLRLSPVSADPCAELQQGLCALCVSTTVLSTHTASNQTARPAASESSSPSRRHRKAQTGFKNNREVWRVRLRTSFTRGYLAFLIKFFICKVFNNIYVK